MRRVAVICLALAGCAGVLAGCGSRGRRHAHTRDGGRLAAEADAGSAHAGVRAEGRPGRGQEDLRERRAARAATRSPTRGATGTVGPNLDQLEAELPAGHRAGHERRRRRCRRSRAQLTPQQIADVAPYVVDGDRRHSVTPVELPPHFPRDVAAVRAPISTGRSSPRTRCSARGPRPRSRPSAPPAST